MSRVEHGFDWWPAPPAEGGDDDAPLTRHAHLWVLADGTGLHAPPGTLTRDAETGRLCCHLCGRWFRSLGSHVRAHGHTADTYRESMGLCRTRALTEPACRRRSRPVMPRPMPVTPRSALDWLPGSGRRERARWQNKHARRRWLAVRGRSAPPCAKHTWPPAGPPAPSAASGGEQEVLTTSGSPTTSSSARPGGPRRPSMPSVTPWRAECVSVNSTPMPTRKGSRAPSGAGALSAHSWCQHTGGSDVMTWRPA